MDKKTLPIGVFDSGLGGISVLRQLQKLMPEEDYIYMGDSAFAPYGVKTKEEISNRCFHIVEDFVKKGVKAIVIACNTATSACVNELRKAYPELIIIGMEPALKLAAKTHERILVMATQFTLKEKKFEYLMHQFADDHVIYKQPCPNLVKLVEDDQLTDKELVHQVLHEYLDSYLSQQIDSIVLGCTHFVFYKKWIQDLCKGVDVIDGNEGTSRHLKELLEEKKIRTDTVANGTVRFMNSAQTDSYVTLSKKLFYFENN